METPRVPPATTLLHVRETLRQCQEAMDEHKHVVGDGSYLSWCALSMRFYRQVQHATREAEEREEEEDEKHPMEDLLNSVGLRLYRAPNGDVQWHAMDSDIVV